MSNYQDQSVGEIVRTLETDFISGTGTLMSKYVRNDLYEDINKIYAYLESKHITGEKDSMGRDKPFFNIVLASRNVWWRATDIDRKNIMAKPTKTTDIVGAFLLSVHLQDWMRRENFGVFLNNWGIELAGFNSAVSKFVEKDGKLIASVVPWSRLIVDQVNFAQNIKIELLELTEQQLYERGYDEQAVKNMCDAARARELTNKQKKDNKNNYYKIYEVHGKMSLNKLTGNDKDMDEFVQQVHILSFLVAEKGKGWDQFTLYKGREEKDPYMMTSLLPATDGSVSLNGSVKNLFDSQWMMNHTAKAIKDQLDLASKLIFQTSDGNFVGQNALWAIENGDILIHQVNQPLSQINNNSHDVTALQSFGGQWKQLSNEINGVSEAMLGESAKAGTAWRQTEALLQESHSLFEVMRENKGLAIEDMCRRYIFPFLMKKMNNDKEVAATLDMNGIKQIEARYIKNEAIRRSNKKIIDTVLSGQIAEPQDLMAEEEAIKAELNDQGAQRFFKPDEVSWKEQFKDLDWDVEVDITGENRDSDAIMTTLNTALQIAANPAFANNPRAQLIVDKILTETGKVSAMELNSLPSPQPVVSPQGGAVGATPLPVTK